MEYTPLQKFYAWVGFLVIAGVFLFGLYEIVHWVIWANNFIGAVS